MFDHNTPLTNPNTNEQLLELKINNLDTGLRYETNELEGKISEQADVFDERMELQKKELKEFIKANIIAVKEDKKPKQNLWNFLFSWRK